MFLRGSKFYMGYNVYVGCVGQMYFCVDQDFFSRINLFYVGQNFLRELKVFA